MVEIQYQSTNWFIRYASVHWQEMVIEVLLIEHKKINNYSFQNFIVFASTLTASLHLTTSKIRSAVL